MLELAFEGNPYFEVSDIELKRGGASYTSDTLRALQALYPEDRLYFIMGTDAFLGIEGWHESEELLTTYSFIVGRRKGYSDEELDAVAEDLKERCGCDVRCFDIPELEISSSDLRLRHQAGRSLKYQVPRAVIDYMDEKGLYSGLLKALEDFAAERQSEKRLRHTRGVVECARDFALIYGADPFKAMVCAWFHDNFKDAGALEHGCAAAEEIKNRFGISDPDILNALRYHTTGRPGMSLLEKVIKLADYLEPSRSYPGVEELRAALSDDIDEALLAILEHTKEYVLAKGQTYDELSQQAIDHYRQKAAKKA
jgi:nicotinate-nucleotide adenylyltransferase